MWTDVTVTDFLGSDTLTGMRADGFRVSRIGPTPGVLEPAGTGL